MLASLQCADALQGAFQVIDPLRCFLQKSITRWCWPYAGMPPLEELCANTLFQVSDSSAHSRLLDI